jgi:two-component system sensor kinase FixL
LTSATDTVLMQTELALEQEVQELRGRVQQLEHELSQPRGTDVGTELLVQANQILQEQIHERRRAIELLEESQERWRSLVYSAPDMIVHINRDRSIGFINHTSAHMRLTPEEMVGQNVLGLVPPESVALVERDLDRVFNDAELISHEVAVPDKDGKPRWYQSHIAPVVCNGRVTGATVVCRDITEFKQAAEALRQTQDRLVHVARVSSVGEMTAALAHELNQPLAAIANFVRGCMIRLQSDGVVTPEILATLQESVDEAHRASEVIRRLRQFLQRQETRRELAQVNDLVQDSLRIAEPALRRHLTQTRLRLSPDLPGVVVDRVQIIQVMLNLLLNAAEAMGDNAPADREVTVETLRLTETVVGLRIADRGPGLPAELGRTIFDPFVTTKPGGLGMGLSISRTIMEAHQGALQVEPFDSGRGARFLLIFPVVEARASA